MNQGPIVFFDGDCLFCNASVLYIFDHDTQHSFRFCSQQSSFGQRVIGEHGPFGDTLFLFENGRFLKRSAAVARIARGLRWWHRLVGIVALALPRGLLDLFYDAFARHRHAFLTKAASCRRPTQDFLNRVISE